MSRRELARSAEYIVQHEYEQASVKAADGRLASLGEFYGDPAVALIDINEQWCAVAGEGLVLCRLEQAFGQCAITDLRQTGPFALEWQGEDGAWSVLDFEPADVSDYTPGR